MSAANLLYAQSGGVTAVINTTAAAVIETARKHRGKIGRVLAARNGVVGILGEELIDTYEEDWRAIKALRQTPGGAFGSCRFKLGSLQTDRARYARLIDVCRAHDVRWLLYNGGNDSADTSLKISEVARELDYPLSVIGVPKTIDNDLAVTDSCPGFGSVAKYVAVSTLEASLDVAAMAESSTKVFVLEVMGRHAGWIAAAAGLAGRGHDEPPHLILFPEKPFDEAEFLARVQETVATVGWCTVVVSEGVKGPDGRFLAESGSKDAFGHSQLGGAAPKVAGLVQDKLGLKVHWAVSDYLQRSARHIASATDYYHAWAVGEAAVKYALAGKSGVMPVIRRRASRPYRWEIAEAPLAEVANHEKKLPEDYLREDGYGISSKARSYLEPLIQGEAYPEYRNGMPHYVRLKNRLLRKKLAPFAF
ncbi:MAG: 6-phosphofructokinase [Xanthomonadales bacterium]|nr:6-phosphofructokinase [Xanthomonadales bacterium]